MLISPIVRPANSPPVSTSRRMSSIFSQNDALVGSAITVSDEADDSGREDTNVWESIGKT